MLHTVFSVDNSAYLRWQAELLAYSFRKSGQSGALTRLLSSSEPMSAFRSGHTFQTRSYAWMGNDDYSPRNRVYALRDWLVAGLPEEESILLLDPDCAFLSSVGWEAEQGLPLAQEIGYMSPYNDNNIQLVRRHGFRPERIQGIGIPILIHREDLRELLPVWGEYLEIIRGDSVSKEYLGGGWTAEMWGYVFAASKLGLWHEIRSFAQFQNEDRDDLPIVHYCFDSRSGEWCWTKRNYPTMRPIEPPSQGGLPCASVALFQLLNEYIETRRTTNI